MKTRTILFLLMLLAVPRILPAQDGIQLTLKQAVEAALEPNGNTRMQLAREAIRQAEARAAQARADMLPDISASIGEQSQTRSLTALGLRDSTLPEGLDLPGIVGPYSTFDASATASQKIFDLSSIRRYQAARTGTQAAHLDSETAKDETAALVARRYLAALRAQAVVETAKANVELSEALVRLADSQKRAGTGTGIDVTRAQVQLANNRQYLLVAETDLTRSRLELLRTLGFDLDIPIELTERLSYSPAEHIDVRQAINTALESLTSLKAQQKREEIASLNRSAVSAERLPSASAFAEYGTTGSSATHAAPTRAYGISVRIPIFDGGRREARRVESSSLLRQEQIRTADLIQEIELNIRIALEAVHSAGAQVKTADEGLSLATNELEQAERRYRAGVTNSIEVTDAQTRLQRARDNQISAVFNHALARLDLAASMGTIQELVDTWR